MCEKNMFSFTTITVKPVGTYLLELPPIFSEYMR